MKIKVTADSTCDLSPEIVRERNITVIPLTVRCGGRSYRDGVDITPGELYDRIGTSGEMGSTAAVNVQDYLDIFSSLLQEYDAVIHFTISAEMSACYQNACLAARELGRVYVIDSRSLSTGIGHLVLDACDLAERGMDPAEIRRILELRREKLDVSFVVTTLDYLRKGGRCTALVAMGANLLRLHPCIFVKNGLMHVGRKYRGKMTDCIRSYVRDRLANLSDVDRRRVFITDSGIDEACREAAESAVRELGRFREIIRTRAGCTVSCHCGPGTLGILFYHT